MDVGMSLPAVSLLFFAAALASRFLVRLLPAPYQVFPWRAFLSALGVPVLASVGLVIGLFGLLDKRGRGLSKLAVALNGVALLIGISLVALFFWILPDPP